MQTVDLERTTTVSGRKLTLKKSFVKALTVAPGVVAASDAGGPMHLTTGPIRPDTYRQCPSCSTLCI
jgi:hypothetical protein